MNKPFVAVLISALSCIVCDASAQIYEFRNGYIFDQPYVQRISLSQAEKIASAPDLFEPLMTFEWTKQKEQIRDPRIKRTGNQLGLEFGGNGRLSLKNFKTKEGDGELQVFKYLKSVPEYHIVGVEYGHDQPQFLLISESGRPIYFVSTN
jgi:hypothetical protein